MGITCEICQFLIIVFIICIVDQVDQIVAALTDKAEKDSEGRNNRTVTKQMMFVRYIKWLMGVK